MTITPDRCPECGEQLRGSADMTPGCALMSKQDDGSYEYDGETDMFWDGQVNVATDPDKIMLQCHNGHEWEAVIADE